MKKIISTIFILAIAFVLIGCHGNKTQNAPASTPGVVNLGPSTPNKPAIPSLGTENTVTISNFVFQPAVLTIKAGATVTWKHDDNVPHQLVSGSLFESPVMNRGDVFTFTFPKAGTYDYNCKIHPSMKGKVIVQ